MTAIQSYLYQCAKWQMMMVISCCFGAGILSAQERAKDTVAPEVVQVLTSYNPSVDDFVKPKRTPIIKITKQKLGNKLVKKALNFDFNPKITPQIGNLIPYRTDKTAHRKPNFVSGHYGMYHTAALKGFLTYRKKKNRFIIHTDNESSNGNVRDVTEQLTSYGVNTIGLAYQRTDRNMYFISSRYQNRRFYWYGMPSFLKNADAISSVGAKRQRLQNISLYGGVDFQKTIIRNARFNFDYFFDALSIDEFYTNANASAFIAPSVLIKMEVGYLRGSRKTDEGGNYGYWGVQMEGAHIIREGDFYLSIGMALRYNKDHTYQLPEKEKNQLFLYPKINISYRLIGDFINVYGAFSGGFRPNTYKKFTEIIPYMNPEMLLRQTNENLNVGGGIKGKFSDQLSYDVNLRYAVFKNHLFFVHSALRDRQQPYAFQNAFNTVYDDTSTLKGEALLRADLTSNFGGQLRMNYQWFFLDKLKTPWNAPNFKLSLNAYFKYGKWRATLEGTMTGARKDRFLKAASSEFETVKLPLFVNMDLKVRYRLIKSVYVYGQIHNLSDNQKAFFNAYPLQSITGVLGLKYQF